MNNPGTPVPRHVVLLVPGGLALLAGLDAALLRLGLGAPVADDRWADVHGPLMVLGFVGTLVALERAVAARRAWARHSWPSIRARWRAMAPIWIVSKPWSRPCWKMRACACPATAAASCATRRSNTAWTFLTH